MAKYVAYLHQDGGCDYTIGCGNLLFDLESDNYNDAILEIQDLLISTYNGNWKLESIRLMEIKRDEQVNIDDIYNNIEIIRQNHHFMRLGENFKFEKKFNNWKKY